jgi:hypothetical protein
MLTQRACPIGGSGEPVSRRATMRPPPVPREGRASPASVLGYSLPVSNRVLRAAAALGLGLLAFTVGQVGWAQPQAPAPSTLTALAGPLYQQLAALKGMASPGPPPPILIRSRDETRRFIQQELDRRYPPSRLEAERKGMVAWGLIPPDYDLRRLFVDLMQEQVAAYYDPVGKVMVVADWLPPEHQQAALMHELVHALQDREISLETFLAPRPGQGDQLLARQALIEGEAVALMLTLLLKAQGLDLNALPDLGAVRSAVVTASVGPAINTAPRFLRDLMIFPYVDGLNFVFQWSKRQPWSSMPALYRDPPRSTAQIMKPDRRLVTREDPVPVTLPDLGTLAPGMTPVAEDELGEFALGAVLGVHMGEPAGRAAAAGWRGDRYRIWEDADGRFVIAYRLVTDGERTATAFAQTYGTVIEKRHPALSGRSRPGASPGLMLWRDGSRAFAVERRGAEILVLEQVSSAIADAARDAIWRSRAAARP